MSIEEKVAIYIESFGFDDEDRYVFEQFAREIERATMERSGAVGDIAAERARQVEKWGNAHDDEHDGMELICAAIVYAAHALHREGQIHGEDRPRLIRALAPLDAVWVESNLTGDSQGVEK